MTGRLFYFVKVALFLLAICMSVTTTGAQLRPGSPNFINIDYGSFEESYCDDIDLYWVSDARYVFTGENSTLPLIVDSSFANHKASTTFRYFPGSSKWNHYLLPTQSQSSSFVPATFYHWDSSILQRPVQFGVFIDSTYLEYELNDSENDLNSPKVFEAVIYNPNPGSNISSLEARAVDSGVYPFPGRSNAFLSRLLLLNKERDPDSRPVRYPADNYDRLWYYNPRVRPWFRDGSPPWTRPPDTLNAVEIYGQFGFETVSTLQHDVDILDILNPRVNSTWSPSLLRLTSNGLAVDVNEILGRMFTFNGILSLVKELDMSDNNLTGTFPETTFSLPLLQTANFDRNKINGTLNLTNWYNWLQSDIKNSSGHAYSREYSFVNNNITAIYPDVNILEPVIKMLDDRSPQFFYETYAILLGGNPWCQTAKISLTQKYLCRFKSDDIRRGRNGTLAIALGSSGGAMGLLVICVLLAFRLYKTRIQVREIHRELAERKVQPQYFSWDKLKWATKNFHDQNKLGSGGFGAVYKGVLENKSVVAVKKLFKSDKVLNEFLNEVVLITGIKHRNLVQLKGCCIEEKQRILVYEYVENGNLADTLFGNQRLESPILPWSYRFKIIVGVARGLAYLHEELQPSIIHRDIKSANVLLDKDYNAKIADFGLAKPYFEEQTQANCLSIAGTWGYFSPEYATYGHLTEKADVYSFGIMTLEILSGRKCIDDKQPKEKVFLKEWAQTLHMEDKMLEIVQPELRTECVDEITRVINIAFLCLQMLHTRRPSMSHVVTMLLGNMEVPIYREEPQENLLDLSDILQLSFANISSLESQ